MGLMAPVALERRMSAVGNRAWSIAIVFASMTAVGCQNKLSVDKWKTVSHSPFRFKMPGEPTRQDQTLHAPEGKVQMATYHLDRGKFVYVATVVTYPSGMMQGVEVERILEGGREGQVNASPGSKLLTSKQIEFKGLPAIEFTYESAAQDDAGERRRTVNHTRALIAGDMAILLMHGGSPEIADDRQALEFWDTLEIEVPSP
jgi:hypothetical protein